MGPSGAGSGQLRLPGGEEGFYGLQVLPPSFVPEQTDVLRG